MTERGRGGGGEVTNHSDREGEGEGEVTTHSDREGEGEGGGGGGDYPQ